MYFGESESKVRQVFSRARASAPCVIFFDELDALCPRRGSGGDSGGGYVSERVVNQLLTELDGLETRRDVYIVAATNRLELIDDAMLRPGRLGKLLYVPLPTPSDRYSILNALVRKMELDESVSIKEIANDSRTDGYSGADLSSLVREASMAIMAEWRSREDFGAARKEGKKSFASEAYLKLCHRHFEAAFKKVRASVTKKDRIRYDLIQKFLNEGNSAVESIRAADSKLIG